jgi:hypothetical protein
MSVPMPVTNRHIVMLSGSAKKAMSTCSVLTGIHENSVTTPLRSSSDFDSRSMKTPTVATNAAPHMSVAR